MSNKQHSTQGKPNILMRYELMRQINILDVLIDNLSMLELLEKLKYGGVVYTPNVDHLIKLQKDTEFYHVYSEADYRVCDSQLLMFAARFLNQPLKEKISGSDLFPAFYEYYRHDPSVKIFILGGLAGVATAARRNINQKVGREMVVDSYSPPFGFEEDETECAKIIELIENSGATVLAVGLGAPKQEKWINRYRHQLKHIKTFFAIGATVDFEAGNLARSPQWMSAAGLEWLYRLMSEPKRLWKRYLVEDIVFFGLILRQKLKLSSKSFISRQKNLFESGQ
jgi:N-acetylglucosaminyldiphosphoundecaprenol N-acetyl-beta-D-mannosaminyltransferase